MIAYLGKEEVKEKYVSRMKAHQEADEIEKGYYWENGKGCAVGCTIEGNDHSRYEGELGIPRAIARLEDRIFEGMGNAGAKEFPLRFLEAIKVGADLSKVVSRFYVTILTDKDRGVVRWATPECEKAIRTVAGLFQETLDGNEVSDEKWAAASAAAVSYADAASSGYAAAAADAATASAAAAASADFYAATASAAAHAADAAAASSDYDDRQRRYDWLAEVLLDILKES